MFSLRSRLLVLRHPLPFGSRSVKHRVDTDEHGIPLRPTWSVNDLLSSYPKPSITPSTLQRLHELSALLPPKEGSPEHTKLKGELEELIRLVEAVKLVKVSSEEEHVPDARIWAEGTGLPLEEPSESTEEVGGQELLRYAAKSSGDMYLVEAERRKT